MSKAEIDEWAASHFPDHQNLSLFAFMNATASPPPLSHRVIRRSAPTIPIRQRRVTWSVLMKRTWGQSGLVCPRCAGPMRLFAVIEHPATSHRILSHLGLPSRAPPRGTPWRKQRDVGPEPRIDGYNGIDPPAFAD